MTVFWFWFLGSQEIYHVLDQKAHTINNIAQQEPIIKIIIDRYVQLNKNNFNDITDEIKTRNNSNIDLFHNFLLPPVIAIAALFLLSLGYLLYSNEKWGLAENVLMLVMVLSFVTEILFYIVVINKYQFIPDTKVVSLILDKPTS